jgi:hypothetical protein
MGTVILAMFREGMDTCEIAKALHLGEADTERMLHQAMEAERKERLKHAGSTRTNETVA